jgi:hypothetical protein
VFEQGMADSFDTTGITDSHSYFVPMVDMLAGVVFILIIMLASVSLVSRTDFSVAIESQAEIKRIQVELERARQLDARYLDPRRTAEAALRQLLRRLQEELMRRGFESESKPEEGRLVLRSAARSDPSVPAPAFNMRIANALAEVLATELPCLADGDRGSAVCAGYPAARLDTVAIAVRDAGNDSTEATLATGAALSLFANVARAEPNLLALRSPGGARLMTYRGLSALEATGAQPDKGDAGQIELHVQMDVPPLSR